MKEGAHFPKTKMFNFQVKHHHDFDVSLHLFNRPRGNDGKYN
jgi:hypothetical protein